MGIRLRQMNNSDPQMIAQAFRDQGWNKSCEQFQNYYKLQESGIREIIIAEYEGQFAGYLTIKWVSDYPFFLDQGIPEIVDFNVLIKYRRRGVGNALMEAAEERIFMVSDTVGLEVGLLSDYGQAQILYAKRGYIPDGLGIHYGGKQLVYFDQAIVDDDLTLGLIKLKE